MQDDQAIFIVWILSCVRHSRSGSDSLGFVFAEFKRACARDDITEKFTKVRRPWTNDYVERLNQTILDEFYRVALRKKIYAGVKKDLNAFMLDYNFRRSHQGYELKENGYIEPSQGFFCVRKCLSLPEAA